MEHAKVSEFFPKPSEIIGLIRTWRSAMAEEKAEEQRRADKEEVAKRIAAGEKMYSYAEVMAEVKRVMGGRSELPMEKKQELRQRISAIKQPGPAEEVYGWGDAIQEFRKVIDAKPDLTDEQKAELRNKLEKLNKGKMAS